MMRFRSKEVIWVDISNLAPRIEVIMYIIGSAALIGMAALAFWSMRWK